MTFESIEQFTQRRRSESHSESLPPALQKLVDKAEEEQSVYEDSWTRRDRVPGTTEVEQQKKVQVVSGSTQKEAGTHPPEEKK